IDPPAPIDRLLRGTKNDGVVLSFGVFSPDPSVISFNEPFETECCPVARDFPQPLHPTVLVLRIPRQAHSAISPSIRMMLAATSFSSASITSSGRGGSNT